jgi:glycerol-3-phosphate acyltransferase PlsY
MMPRVLTAAALGYLVGSLPAADTVARLASGGRTDLRAAGTGNPGAVNAIHVLGWGWGWAILVIDTMKGVAACELGSRVGGPGGAHVAGTSAVIGHCFPVWKGFRGGKGVAVSLGQCLATFPAYLPVDLGVT